MKLNPITITISLGENGIPTDDITLLIPGNGQSRLSIGELGDVAHFLHRLAGFLFERLPEDAS